MPLQSGHYRNNHQSNSNPFNHYQPAQNTHAGLYQHTANPSASFHTQTQLNHNNGPNGFPAAHQNGNVGIFSGGAGLTNGAGAAFTNGAGTGLGSHEAQLGFERGAALQRQQHQQQGQQGQAQMTAELLGGGAGAMARGHSRIREVWAGNLEQEMDLIRTLALKYPCVSMDTEFPGIVARPIGQFPTKSDYHYQCLRCNVDLLKLIQLGLTLFSHAGDLPPASTSPADLPLSRSSLTQTNLTRCPCTWTFNFKFSLATDMYAQDSIDLLQKSGLDFAKNESQGIHPQDFASLLITSGLVLDPSVSWLSFHSGYDFGYLLKIITSLPLPPGEDDYLSLVRAWFPRIYDIKFLLRNAQSRAQKGILNTTASETMALISHRSSLQDIADSLGIAREGRAHTAGSDAWLTGQVFWTLRQKVFDNAVPEDLVGMVWGISAVGPPASKESQQAALSGGQTPQRNGAELYRGLSMTPGRAGGAGGGAGGGHVGVEPSTPQNMAGVTAGPGMHGHGTFAQQAQQSQQGGAMAGLGGAFGQFGYGR